MENEMKRQPPYIVENCVRQHKFIEREAPEWALDALKFTKARGHLPENIDTIINTAKSALGKIEEEISDVLA
jgi:hypothetical protein